MQASIRFLAADLHYPKDLQVHTAASGLIGTLSARYLEIERSDGFRGIGEIRANITYLSKLPEEAVDPAIRGLCRMLPWTAPPEDILSALQKVAPQVPHVASAVVENALLEGIARSRAIPVAQLLGAAWRSAVDTNQCLFWSPDETFDRLAARFCPKASASSKSGSPSDHSRPILRVCNACVSGWGRRCRSRSMQTARGTRTKRWSGCGNWSGSICPMWSSRRIRAIGMRPSGR